MEYIINFNLTELEVKAVKFLYFLYGLADLERTKSKVHYNIPHMHTCMGRDRLRCALTLAHRVAPMITQHLTNCLDDKAAANGE